VVLRESASLKKILTTLTTIMFVILTASYRYMVATKSNNQIKTTWDIITQETGKLHLTEQIPSNLTNYEKAKNPEEIAGAFNTFFYNCRKSKLALRSERICHFIFKRGIS
jgi:hypothetical protein